MATEMLEGTPVGAELPDILGVIEGTLVVNTNDRVIAGIAYTGFRYLLALEFARQQPALALLYDFDIKTMPAKRGSIRIPFKIWVKLKRHVAAEVKKAGVAAIIIGVLNLPGAINESEKLFHEFFPPIQSQLHHDLRSCSPVIEITDIRLPDDRDIFDKETPRSFDL
jgi:hypothetical protein